MQQRWLGPAVVALGAVILIVGIIGTVGGSDASAEAASTTTTLASTSSTSSSTSSSSTSTQPSTTTSTPSTTTTQATTTSSSTTSTTEPAETVEEFVPVLAAAIDAGDNEFVFSRLHPVVVESWGEELCRGWVDREIMALEQYTLISVDQGPITQTFTTPAGNVTVMDFYASTVSFTFEGEPFETTGAFALLAPDMYFLGQCR